MKFPSSIVFVFVLVLFCSVSTGVYADWPTYLHDNARSGVTSESPQIPLKEIWVYKSTYEPNPAWPSPSTNDYWHRLRRLRPLMTFDRAYHTVIENDCVYFGSSADHKVYCLDAGTGRERWNFFTEGPIRFAPVFHKERLYVGSDDGFVYCLDAEDGSLLWKHRPGPKDHRLPGNSEIISLWPIRTGLVIDDEKIYCVAGIFPRQGVYLSILDTRDGSVLLNEKIQITPQGYLLASENRLYVPTGRTSPAVFSREDGKYIGALEGNGGAYALLVDETLINGPGRRDTGLGLADNLSQERVATFDGVRLVAKGDMAYLLSKTHISAFNRGRHLELARQKTALEKKRARLAEQLQNSRQSATDQDLSSLISEMGDLQQEIEKFSVEMDKCFKWEQPCAFPYSLILAGDMLIAGGDGMVALYHAKDGKEIQTVGVTGRAYGLAVADGNLLVSTDKGFIYCFGHESRERQGMAARLLDRSPYPQDDLSEWYAKAASHMVAQSQTDKGYCLILGSDIGRLAYEIAQQSKLKVIGYEIERTKIEKSRQVLDAAGLYGPRIVIHEAISNDLPYVSHFANLIVSDAILQGKEISIPASEVFRVLRPGGGTLCFGQPGDGSTSVEKMDNKILENWSGEYDFQTISSDEGMWLQHSREPLPGIGEWTHLYADPGNTSCSNDLLDRPEGIQWFGRPGSRYIIDRHHRPMSPLYKNGRLYVAGSDRIFAVDGYNGTILWKLDVPYSRRIGALKDSGYMVVTDEFLYVAAEEECRLFDAKSGEHVRSFRSPQLSKNERRDWGYISTVGDRLFGTCTKAGASFYEMSEMTCDILEGDFREMIFADYLFSMDRRTGEELWTYRNGKIFNNTIAAGENSIYLIESRNEETLSDPDGRISAHIFCKSDNYLVELDMKTGEKLYERSFQFPFEHIMFLSYTNGYLVAVGTYNVGDRVHYGLYTFDAKNGELKWKQDYEGDPIGGTHGEQWQHPVIIGEKVYSRPYQYDLVTGEKGKYYLDRGGHGCGGLSGCAAFLFGRGDNPRFYEIHDRKETGTPLSLVNRPGCWINIIPAGGLVLLPESSSGCTCAFPLQLSIAFRPVE